MNTFKTILIVFVLVLSACNKESELPNTKIIESTKTPITHLHEENNEFFPDNTTQNLVQRVFYGDTLIFRQLSDGNLVIGDMVFTEQDIINSNTISSVENDSNIAKGVAIRDKNKRWTRHISATNDTTYQVAYAITPFISSFAPERSQINAAIKHFEDRTKLRFVLKTTELDYIYVEKSGTGCHSFVGKKGGKQILNIGTCLPGNIIHEFGHAIGLYHEQQHPKRDDSLIVHTSNIIPRYRNNFTKLSKQKTKRTALDFNSIMMYSSWAFTIDKKKPTMTRKNGDTFGAQRDSLSKRDIKVINKIYQ